MLSLRFILTQVLLIVIIWFAGKFGKKPLVLITMVLLLTSLFHLFSLGRLFLQVIVILAAAGICYHKIREQEVREMVAAFRQILERLGGK